MVPCVMVSEPLKMERSSWFEAYGCKQLDDVQQTLCDWNTRMLLKFAMEGFQFLDDFVNILDSFGLRNLNSPFVSLGWAQFKLEHRGW